MKTLLIIIAFGCCVATAELAAAGGEESFVHDSMAGTWLPTGKTNGMRLLACWYRGAKLIATREFSGGGLQTSASRWDSEVRTAPQALDASCKDYRICTSSGDALFKIYRAGGDHRYAELIRDVVHAHAEGIKPGGEITERLTYCDADNRGSRGGGSTGWNELNGILMAMELPGIYVRSDTDEMFVFDHVEAKVIGHDNTGVTLDIANSTKFDAKVTIFAETALEAAQPLGCTAFLKWPKYDVKAGASRRIIVK